MQIAVYGSLNILSFWKILNGSVGTYELSYTKIVIILSD